MTERDWIQLVVLVAGLAANYGMFRQQVTDLKRQVQQIDKKVSNGLSANIGEIYGLCHGMAGRMIRVETILEQRREQIRVGDKEVVQHEKH